MEVTLTFTRRQTRRVEGTCTHKHLVSLRDSHSGGQRTHSHALTENGRTTHSHVPPGGKSTLTFTLSHRRERKHTPHHSHKGWRKHSLTLSLSHTEGIARSLSFSHIEGNGHTLSFSHTSAKTHSLSLTHSLTLSHSLSLSLRQHGKHIHSYTQTFTLSVTECRAHQF